MTKLGFYKNAVETIKIQEYTWDVEQAVAQHIHGKEK
jgi:hypothetical protein